MQEAATTRFHATYFAHELTKRCPSDSVQKLAATLAYAQVDLNPHQIDASLFAFRSPLSIRSFWHTASPLDAFIFWTTETTNYPSPVHQFAHDLRKGWADFLTDLYGAAARRDEIQPHLLQSNLLPAVIDGVEIHCLSPDEAIRNKFERVYRSRVSGERAALPNPNSLSAILALRWGSSVALLGGDALKENWDSAHGHYHRRHLPKAIVFKVPHHGARNAMNWQAASYLDLCARGPSARAVLFAGDADHPDADVYRKLRP